MIYLEVIAPFAAFREFSACATHVTAPFVTHSAAYGLCMNLAGVDTRKTRAPAEVAVGVIGELPTFQTTLQQMHKYPSSEGNIIKGMSAEEKAAYGSIYHGQKNLISPIRRQFLSGIHAVVGLKCLLESEVVRNLEDGVGWGLPFLGDNAFLIEDIRIYDQSPDCKWWYSKKSSGADLDTMVSTITIDRRDSSRTTRETFELGKLGGCPEDAWVRF